MKQIWKDDNEINADIEESIRQGYMIRHPDGMLSITEKGKQHVLNTFPRTTNRAKFGKMSIREFMKSADEENPNLSGREED